MSKAPDTAAATERPDHEIVVIGAGIGGLGTGATLRRNGLEDFVILERADDLGGVWRDNTYPGVAVDVPSLSYQFSYDLKPDWSGVYAKGAEVKQYLDEFADKQGLRPHLRLHTEVLSRGWDDDAHLWRLETAGGEITARYVISCIGTFPEPLPVQWPGFEDFEGKVLQSMHWDGSYDLRGKRVAVIGTGASALQLVPEVADMASHLDVYQRTPIWVGRKFDLSFKPWFQRLLSRSRLARQLTHKASMVITEFLVIKMTVQYAKMPWVAKGIRKVMERYHANHIEDPDLHDRLTPDYEFACKRPSVSNRYLQTFARDHVDLVTDPIERFVPSGIRTSDGEVRPIDAVVLATGFLTAFDPKLYRMRPVRGRDGFDLADHWERNRISAYEGVSIPQLPNHFFIYGPHSGIAGTFHPLVEVGSEHIARVITEARKRGATSVAVREEPFEAYHRDMLERLGGSLWFNGNCSTSRTYYVGEHGDVLLLRPQTTKHARERARTSPMSDYRFDALPAPGPDAATPATAAA